MKAIKIVLYALLIIIALTLIVAALTPKDVTITRSVTIASNPDLVYYQVANLKNWEKWSPFEGSDMESTYSGQFASAGMARSWTSKLKGDGSMEIMQATPCQSIDSKMNMANGNHGTEHWTFETDTANNTVVTWEFTFRDLSYPFQRLLGLVADNVMGTIFQQGLNQLKSRCDSIGRIEGIELIDVNAFSYQSIHDTLSLEEMEQQIGGMYTEIFAYLLKEGIQPAGPTIAIYHEWNPPTRIIFEAGVPVAEFKMPSGRILNREFQTTRALKYTFTGNYNDLAIPHEKLQQYADLCGFTLQNIALEEYTVTPEQETDPSKWITKVIYPVILN